MARPSIPKDVDSLSVSESECQSTVSNAAETLHNVPQFNFSYVPWVALGTNGVWNDDNV